MAQRERSVGLSQTGIPPVARAAIFEDGGHCTAHQGGDSARRGAEQRILPFFFCPKTLRKVVSKSAKYETVSPTQIPFHNQPLLEALVGRHLMPIAHQQVHAAVLPHRHAMRCRACTRVLLGLSRLAAPASLARSSCVRSNPFRGGKLRSAQEYPTP